MLPRFIDGRRIRAWRKGDQPPVVGDEAHGRKVVDVRPMKGGKIVVFWKAEGSEGGCTPSRWKTWCRTGDELVGSQTDFFRNKGEQRRRGQRARIRDLQDSA